MLKVEHSIDYLKKGRSSSETFEGEKHVKQIISQRKALRFKRSDDNPELPENFKVGQAIGGGDCFFDSVAKGLKQLKPEMDFTVKSLREVCKRFAQSQLENDQSWLKGALRNEAEPISVYVPRIEFTADDIEQKSGSVNVLGLTSPIWGRSEIEGRIICKEYNVKLHVVEKHVVEGKEVWLDQIVNSEGSRSMDSIDYNEENTIHIINRGNAHFEPILSTQEIQHNKRQSPDPSDYDDEITPEVELINIIKSRDSEEEKLTKIKRLFEKEPKPDINFQDKDNDTPLHIAIRKKELKVIEWLVKNGAKIDIKNSRGRTQLEVAQHLERQDIVEVLKSHIQPNLQVSVERSSTQQKRTRTDSKEDKSEDSSHKRPRTSLQAAEESRGRKRTQNEENELGAGQVKKLKTSEGYPASGLKSSLHGTVYQLKLLMLFLKRGLDQGYSFDLATEMDAAEKFDDVVFQYTEGGEEVYRFLQAKHKQDDNKKITVNDLLTEQDDEFSLQKYFISYRKIKQNPEFKGYKLKDFVICTNIDLEESLRNSFEPVEGEDNILRVNGEKSERLKLKVDKFPNKKDLVSRLSNTSELNRLAKRLAKCVLENKPLDLKDDLFRSYHGVLGEKVIDVKNVEQREEKDNKGKEIKKSYAKFRSNFLDGSSQELENFRSAFLKAYQEMSKEQMNVNEFWQKMKARELQISQTFGKVFELDINPQLTDLEVFAKEIANAMSVAKQGVVNIKREKGNGVIKDNINKLAGHVLIKKSDKEKDTYYFSSTFFDDNNKLPGNLESFKNELKAELESKVMEFDKDKYKFHIANFKTCEEEQLHLKTFLPDDHIDEEEIESFFEKLVFAVNQPNEIELGGIIEAEMGEDKDINLIDSELIASKFQGDVLNWMKEKKGRFFTHEDGKAFFKEAKQKISKLVLIGPTLEYRAKIEEFGIAFSEEPSGLSNFLASHERQIFNLISQHKTILSSIKVCQTLKGIPEYQKNDSHIFVRLSSLLRMKDHVIKAFESSNLLVIECKAAEENVDELCHQLSKVTRSSDNKKIILITQENDPLVGKFKDNFSVGYEEKKDERNSLTDLTVESQEKLLRNKKVTFQGEEVSLDILIDQESKRIIDAEVLSKLIEEKEIKIGSKVPQKSDLGSPAYNIIMPEEIKIERFKDEDIKNNLFVISEVKEEKLINLGITEEKICSFDDCDLNDKNTKQFFLLNSKDRDKNIEDFETVCHNYPDKMIHFIEFKDNKFMWNRYYDPKFYTDREFYQIEIDATELSKYATKVGKEDEILAVSGITKEDFEKRYEIDKRVIAFSKDGNLDRSQPIIILSNGDEEKDFSRLSDGDRLKGFNIHWLESKGTKLFWKRSKGETSKLSKLVVSEPDLTHNSLLDIVKDTRSTVIAGLSGMGKSTTLTLLAESYKKEKGLDWVIRVNLRDYSGEIDKLPDEYDLQEEVVKFFSVIDKEGLEDTFAKNLFKHRLKKENDILLLFDGFDEISSGQKEGDTGQSADKQKKITSLLKFLKDKTNARIVVTTRPYEKEKTSLENELSVLSYTFKPIENERQEFLKNFWKRSLKLKYSENEIKESQYEEFAQGLIRKFNKAVNEEKSRFMGIPLHLRILAEVYLEKFEKDRQNDDFKDLNIFDLYKEFVDRKYKIYFSEKTGLSSTGVTNADLDMLREQYEKMHKRLAFKYLFSGSAEPFKLFFSAESEGSSFIENKMPNEEKTRELKRIGIIQSKSKDDIDFIHSTFAEYFVSKLIYERLKRKLENPNYSQESKDEMRKFLLNYIFIKEENNVIRSFINSELADKSANLENFWSGKINSLENKEQLLLAVKEGLGNIFSFLLHSEEDKGINKELISVPRKHIEKLCDNGEYREANLFPGNALKFLIEELREDHLEIAIMQRYLGNAYGTLAENTKDERKKEELFNKKKEFLEKALSTFSEHLKVAKVEDAKHQEDYLQQALSTFKEDLKSIEAQTAKGLDESQRKVWIRVLKIQIAQVKRNLANAYGDLGNHEKKKKLLEEALFTFKEDFESIEAQTTKDPDKNQRRVLKIQIAQVKRNLADTYGDSGNHEKKKELLEEALSTFEEYEEELRIAETKRNLGNAYGKLGNHPERKRLLEEALPALKKHYGLFDSKVAKAQENLSKAYKNLEYPLHGAVIVGNYKKVEDLINDNVNHQTNDDLVTPLHLAVREGHSDIVKLLLEKQADPDIKDKNGETPLELANKQLNQNSQIYQEIIDIFKSKSINQQQENHPVNQGSEVLSEECLSSTSHNRKKREAKGECLFTWEDVDEFNAEKDERRDFSKINIDSEKFVDYIKDLPEGKRSQLIQLADKVKVTGESQSLVNKLIGNQKVISYLNRVGRISGMTMHGMMAKNILADFLNGNDQGVAINVGFIAGGQGFAKVAQAASLKGLKLASEGKLLLGRSLRAASPFLARGTSAFVIYDLVNQIKAFKNGTEEALVGVVGDSIYLGVDAAEIGIEVAEAFEVLEGVSSVTGPIGATIGAVVFVGTDIYMAVKRVDKIDQIIHLTGDEKFVEGLRAFIGMKPEQYVQELIEEKQLNNQLVKQGLEYLKQHSDVQKYVFPTKKIVCHQVINNKTVCVIPGTYDGICVKHAIKTFYTEKCTPVIEMDSRVILDRKRTDVKWSRAKPDNPDGGQVFCLPQGDYEPAPNYGSYLCESAIGVTDLSANKTGGYTLINLGEGKDNVKGFLNNPNIFVVSNGFKEYYGGNKDDIFILNGNYIKGYLDGGKGIDTLDLTEFAQDAALVKMDLSKNTSHIIYYGHENRSIDTVGLVQDALAISADLNMTDYLVIEQDHLSVSGIERVLGRKGKSDLIYSTCGTDFLDGQGSSKSGFDVLRIENSDCVNKVKIVVRPDTHVENKAYHGEFNYIVLPKEGKAVVNITSLLEGIPTDSHNFFFNSTISDLVGIYIQNVSQIFNYTVKSIAFSFLSNGNKSERVLDDNFDEARFNITISDIPVNASYVLGNGAEIKMGNKGNMYMLENTNKSVEETIKNYLPIANRLNKMSFFIQSLLSNETVVIGSGNHEVIHNNLVYKSHLVGNGGENVYVIDSEADNVPEVIIHDVDEENSIDTIDLRNVVKKAKDNFELQVIKSENDLLLRATVEKEVGINDEYFAVRLKDGVERYNKTHVIVENAPMRISVDNNQWSLKPQPLMFEKDKEIIVVTDQDVEKGSELITPRKGGNYTFVRDHGSDLIITNAFNTNVAKNDLCTIVLSKFYEKPKLATLSIKFSDKEIVLKDKQKEIKTARYVDVVKREHKEQVYSDVFNRSPEVMLSDQPHRHQIRHRRSTSGSARTSSWINDLFGWVKSSIDGLLSSALSKETSSTSSPISQVDAKMDVNGTIMLLDVIVRKFTGKQYIPAVDQSIPLLEARGYALNITNRFEKVLNKTAIKSGISVTNLNFDPVVVQSAIIGKIINGKFSEIAKTLYSIAKEACPEFKQTDKFLAHLKSNLEGEKETALLQQKIDKPSEVLDQQVSRKVELLKRPNTFLNGTSVVKGISNVLEL